jgi:hypothetical protein
VRNSTTLHGAVDRDEAGAIDGTGAVGVSAGAVGISGDASNAGVSVGAGVAGASWSNLCTSTFFNGAALVLTKVESVRSGPLLALGARARCFLGEGLDLLLTSSS